MGVRRSSLFFLFLFYFITSCGKECEYGIKKNSSPVNNTKFVLSLFHFNIQYIAGGLTGEGGDTLSNRIMEDLIVRESFEPVLDLYLRHRSWKTDIELQGYMLEVLKERHPDVLNKLKELVFRGQVELISFHYSDQLYLAFPEEDMEWSYKLNMEILKNSCISVSPAVFTQEGQFGIGTFSFMKKKGYELALLPRGIFKYHFGGEKIMPLYKIDDVYVIIAPEPLDFHHNGKEFSLRWAYYGDGEILATGGIAPYFILGFKLREENIRDFEQVLLNYEKEGYSISTASEYLSTLLKENFEPHSLKPFLDSTWQPYDSDNLFLWMGGRGIFGDVERDNFIRTLNWQSRDALSFAEFAINYLNDTERERAHALLKKGWIHQLKAEVSDSTGWNPVKTEVNYSIYHSTEVFKITREIFELAQVQGTSNQFDPAPYLPSNCLKDEEFVQESTFPVNFTISGESEYIIERCISDPDLYRLTFIFSTSPRKIDFPFNLTYIHTAPALMDEKLIKFYLSEYVFDHICLPLPTGIIEISENVFLIKDNFKIHLAGCVYPQDGKITFEDKTNDNSFEWRFFFVFKKGEDAIKFALRWNKYNPHFSP